MRTATDWLAEGNPIFSHIRYESMREIIQTFNFVCRYMCCIVLCKNSAKQRHRKISSSSTIDLISIFKVVAVSRTAWSAWPSQMDSTEFSPSLLFIMFTHEDMSIKQEYPDPFELHSSDSHLMSYIIGLPDGKTTFNTTTGLPGFFSCCFGLVIPADGPPGSTDHDQCPQCVGKRLTCSTSNPIAERMWTMWKNNHHPNENEVPGTNARLAISVM